MNQYSAMIARGTSDPAPLVLPWLATWQVLFSATLSHFSEAVGARLGAAGAEDKEMEEGMGHDEGQGEEERPARQVQEAGTAWGLRVSQGEPHENLKAPAQLPRLPPMQAAPSLLIAPALCCRTAVEG